MIKTWLKNFIYKQVEVEVVEIQDIQIVPQFVYNIEIEDNHNYFANNILVSNCHLVKNPKTVRAKSVSEIIKETEKLWLLTGTPMSNRPIDYFSILKMIKHPIANNWVKYGENYCAGVIDYFGHYDFSGASNLEELYNKTKDLVLRRLKTSVLKDLPNKERTPIYLHLPDKKGYKQVIKDYEKKKFELFLVEHEMFSEEDIPEAQVMTKFLLWRQYCALKKIEDGSLVELIEGQLNEGHKIIVFTNFVAVVDAVVEKFKKISCFIDGRIKEAKERLEIVKEFNNNDDLKILVCNLAVGSVGLNIQSANVLIINDMSWVPTTMVQAEDRAWRIGQKKNVNVFYPIYKDTIEEVVFNIINEKMKVISASIEGKEETFFATNEVSKKDTRESILQEIFKQLK